MEEKLINKKIQQLIKLEVANVFREIIMRCWEIILDICFDLIYAAENKKGLTNFFREKFWQPNCKNDSENIDIESKK